MLLQSEEYVTLTDRNLKVREDYSEILLPCVFFFIIFECGFVIITTISWGKFTIKTYGFQLPANQRNVL